MPLRIFFINFHRGYHVGWKRPRKIIDHITVLRALISLAYEVNNQVLAKKVSSGEVSATALLPVVQDKGYARLLAPFPILPSLTKMSKLGVTWATLVAIKKVVSFAQECVDSKGKPVLKGRDNNGIIIECVHEGKTLKLTVKQSIACIDGEDCRFLPEPRSNLFQEISEYRNRIDRVTGTADLYRISGWKPNTPLWVCFRGDEEALKHISNLMEILEKVGLGAYRSRGWGLFQLLENLKPHKLDLDVLEKHSSWTTGYNMLLGLTIPGEWLDQELSYGRSTEVTGIAGPVYEEYKLPLIHAIEIGSLVYVKYLSEEFGKKPIPQIIRITTSLYNYRPIIVFNPLVVNNLG